MKKNTWEEGFVEKGAVDGITSDKTGLGRNGADEISKTDWDLCKS